MALPVAELQIHPRVAQQGVTLDALGLVLTEAVPKVVPFRERTVHSMVAMLDWDHRLPSKALTLRLHVLYDDEGRARFNQALELRRGEITSRDKYPEFDVPDYAGLPSDEAYDVELSSDLTIENMRLVSPWRRDVAPEESERAVVAVRASQQFADIRKTAMGRSASLGDLEAVAWTPPCETTLPAWTLDVWWLTAFDGRTGRGWSFLVDMSASEPKVVAAREFNIRAG
jgi:hypothetical protein